MRLIVFTLVAVSNVRPSKVPLTTYIISEPCIDPSLHFKIEEYYTLNQTFKCMLCPDSPTFSNLTEGTQHLAVQHRNQANTNLLFVASSQFECKICMKQYGVRNIMIGHMKRKHNLTLSPNLPSLYTGVTLIQDVREVFLKDIFRRVEPKSYRVSNTFPRVLFRYHEDVLGRYTKRVTQMKIKKSGKSVKATEPLLNNVPDVPVKFH